MIDKRHVRAAPAGEEPPTPQPQQMMNEEQIERGIRLILEGIGVDMSEGDLKNTPGRYVRSCREIFGGYAPMPKDYFKLFPAPNPATVVAIDVPVYTTCEHHLLTIIGKCHVRYLPNKYVIGWSKVPRIVQHLSHRLQLQERLTGQIAEVLYKTIQPQWLEVKIHAQHLCGEMRGARCPGRMTTKVRLPEVKK